MKEPKTLTWNNQQANFFHLCQDSVTSVRTLKKRVNKPTKFDTTETLLAHIAIFPPKNRSDNFRRILEGMKGKDLRKLASNATDELKTCDDTKKR